MEDFDTLSPPTPRIHFMVTLDNLDISSKVLLVRYPLNPFEGGETTLAELNGGYIAKQPDLVDIPLGNGFFLTKISGTGGNLEYSPIGLVNIFLKEDSSLASSYNIKLKVFGKHSVIAFSSEKYKSIALSSIGDNVPLREVKDGSKKLRLDFSFEGITKLKPENLLKNHPNISHFRYLLSDFIPKSHKHIPSEDILDYPTPVEELPYDLLENGEKIYLWERQGKPGYPSEIDGDNCFHIVWKEKYRERSEEAGILEYYNTWFDE